MNEVKRKELPDWPRLMSEELAASYLGIGHTYLREQGPAPKRLGRRRLYDRIDLDVWADRLGGQPLEGRALELARRDTERRFFEEQEAKRGRS